MTESDFRSLLFSNFSKLCDTVATFTSKKKKAKALEEYYESFRNKFPNIDFHLLLRFLLPGLDRERGAYGIKEHNLAKLYIRILDLPKNGKDANTLMQYKRPKNINAEDFADVAYWIFRNRCGNSTKISLGEVDDCLEQIVTEHASHNSRKIDDLLTIMFQKMSAVEQKWFTRLLLKNLHLNLGVTTILNLYHPDAMKLFESNCSLRNVSKILKNKNQRLDELKLNLFNPFKPMLSLRCDISEKVFTGEYFVDEKLDGERFQIHYKNGEFKYFSRNAFDFTYSFGKDKDHGYLTPLIASQLKSGVDNFIIDGEMMCWHKFRKVIIPKSSNIDVKSRPRGDPVQPCFSAFDVLYFNENVLINKPLKDRLEFLNRVFEPLEGVIIHTPRIRVSNNDDILKALNSAIDYQFEGVIVKEPNSIYVPNGRKCGWFKLKPEYSKGALVELDLIIIGGYYGIGKRKGCINQFLLGLVVPNTNEDSVTQISSLVRVGSGYTILELEELLKKLNPHWQKFLPSKVPKYLLLGKEKPDLWIEPFRSFVLQVKASEVIKSDLYHFGYTLRFPRVEKVRYDKAWNDALKTEEFANLVKTYSAKLTSGHVNKKRDSHGNLLTPVSNEPSVSFKPTSIPGNETFRGKRICVMSGDSEYTKEKLGTMIGEHAGSIVEAPDDKTYCVVIGDLNVRAKNVVEARKHLIVKPKWIADCVEATQLLPFEPNTTICAPPRKTFLLQKRLKQSVVKQDPS